MKNSPKDLLALVVSLVKRDKRGVTKVAEMVSPFGFSEVLKPLVQSDDPGATKLIDTLNRLKQVLGESGDPKSFEAIEERVADAVQRELEELLKKVRRNDPEVRVVARDDMTTGLRIVQIVTKLPPEAHIDRQRQADAYLDLAFRVADREPEA